MGRVYVVGEVDDDIAGEADLGEYEEAGIVMPAATRPVTRRGRVREGRMDPLQKLAMEAWRGRLKSLELSSEVSLLLSDIGNLPSILSLWRATSRECPSSYMPDGLVKELLSTVLSIIIV